MLFNGGVAGRSPRKDSSATLGQATVFVSSDHRFIKDRICRSKDMCWEVTHRRANAHEGNDRVQHAIDVSSLIEKTVAL